MRFLDLGAPLRGALAAGLVGVAGAWNGPAVLALALTGGLAFFDLGRRRRVEHAATITRDPYGAAMQLAFLALLCAGAWENRSPEATWRSPGLLGVAGSGLLLAGVGLRHSAARALGRHFTVALALLDDHELVASGPYRWIRHPNYAALLLIALGTAMMVGSTLALGVAIALWLPLALLRIRAEERVLEARLGPRWTEYASTRWSLLPGVY